MDEQPFGAGIEDVNRSSVAVLVERVALTGRIIPREDGTRLVLEEAQPLVVEPGMERRTWCRT